MRTIILQAIDRAWVSEQVIHVFDAAGIKNPMFPFFPKTSWSNSKAIITRRKRWKR